MSQKSNTMYAATHTPPPPEGPSSEKSVLSRVKLPSRFLFFFLVHMQLKTTLGRPEVPQSGLSLLGSSL